VGLVLKTMNTKPDNPEWLAFLKECQSDKRIQLITDTLERSEVLGLINTCDAYVSLHRAEGFGRTLAEAMMLGKPVIATNYSGNVDFMHIYQDLTVGYQLIPISDSDYQWVSGVDNAYWAEAKISEASQKMINCMNRKNIVNSLMLKFFSPSNIADFILKYLVEQEV
jgi:glycosyltransferase involved in cell wall biosynthesis